MANANKLKKVSSQLKKSVTAHAKQADIIDGYLSSIKSKSPAMNRVKAKGGGTKKVCLPLAKIRSMSSSEKSKIVRAKRKAGAAGKYKRSSKSNTTGTSSGGSLKNWVKQDWRQVANPSLKCGEKAPGERKSPAKKAEPRKTIGRGKNFNKANPTGTGAKAGGGMTQKGVNEYKRKNPGSKLKTAVTKDPSKLKPGSKDAKRRKSFCARSKSWKGERGLAARRRWNC
jgi:hypothetical protein|tara:strand:- start:240 stop:920 length:681 start_codon:yes stop_codon:yes gene_type:complete